MRKKWIRGFGILAFCFLTSVIPVKAADAPITLVKEGDEVKVVLSKAAIEDEVHSLHVSFEIDVAQGELRDVSFQWALGDGVYTKEYRGGEGGHITLDVYASAREDLFSSGGDRLTLGTVKLTADDGGATTLVKAENLGTVNGVQEMNEDTMSFVEVSTGDGTGGNEEGGGDGSQQPGDGADGNGSGWPEGGNTENGSGGSTGNGSGWPEGGNAGNGSGSNTGNGSGGNTGGSSGNFGGIFNNGFFPGTNSSQTPNMAPTGTVSGNKGGNLANHIKNSVDPGSGTADSPTAWKPRDPEEGAEGGEAPLPEDDVLSFPEEEDSSESFEEFIEEAKEERSKGMGQGVKIFLIVCAVIILVGGAAAAVLLYTASKAQKGRPLTRQKKHRKNH